MTQARLAKQAIHNWRQGKLWMPSWSEIQQYPNVQQLVALLSFISSFLFLSVSCLLFRVWRHLPSQVPNLGGGVRKAYARCGLCDPARVPGWFCDSESRRGPTLFTVPRGAVQVKIPHNCRGTTVYRTPTQLVRTFANIREIVRMVLPLLEVSRSRWLR